jgi:hypothetical protein
MMKKWYLEELDKDIQKVRVNELGEKIHVLENKETEMTNIKFKETNKDKEQRKRNNQVKKLKEAEKAKKILDLKTKERKNKNLSENIEKMISQKESIKVKIKVH